VNLIRALVEALNPCVHQWEKIDLLHDDPKDPSETTVIRMCSICGEMSTVTIEGPPKRPKPYVCPPHKWERVDQILVQPSGTKANDPTVVPVGRVIVYRCAGCGEEKTRILRPDGFEDEKPKKRKAA
jgi:predicted RNA-binding Zn-ribbon protein involved in translation (DUF1610 family)